MAQFSIREALRFSCLAYAKHVALLLAAGLLVGASLWMTSAVPLLVAQKLGIPTVTIDMLSVEPATDSPSLSGTIQSQRALAKVQEAIKVIIVHIQNTPKHHLLLLLILCVGLWLLHMFFVMGLVKNSLAIRDTGKGSVALLFEAGSVFWRWIGATLLFGSYLMCMVLGMSVLTIPFAFIVHAIVHTDNATALIALGTWAVLLLAILLWAASYLFFGFCLLDNKPKGARQALSMSQDLAKGSRIKIVATVVILSLIGYTIEFLIKKSVALTEVMVLQDMIVIKALTVVFLIPLVSLCLASMYRSLSR
jgi:hypothetical protein